MSSPMMEAAQAKGVDAIFVNGRKVAEGRIEHTQPIIFSADEGADIGENGDTVVGEDDGIRAPWKFTGKIINGTINLKEMKQAERAQENMLLAEAALVTEEMEARPNGISNVS